MSSSDSLRYSESYSPLGRSFLQRVYIAFAGNGDLCLSFLGHCVDYGEKVFTWCRTSIASSTSSRVGALNDLRERTARFLSEATCVAGSTENVVSAQGLSSSQPASLIPITDTCGYFRYRPTGSRRFKTAYKKALKLEQKTTSGWNALLEIFSSWAAVADGPFDDALQDVVTLEQLGEVKWAWEKARDAVRAAQETRTSEPAQRMAPKRPRVAFKRWMKGLVCFS